MLIEITAARIQEGIIEIYGIDVSEENLQRMERSRDDGVEQEIQFLFDTRDSRTYGYIRRWLKTQKAARGKETWGSAVQAVVGTITEVSGRYRNWE